MISLAFAVILTVLHLHDLCVLFVPKAGLASCRSRRREALRLQSFARKKLPRTCTTTPASETRRHRRRRGRILCPILGAAEKGKYKAPSATIAPTRRNPQSAHGIPLALCFWSAIGCLNTTRGARLDTPFPRCPSTPISCTRRHRAELLHPQTQAKRRIRHVK